MSSAFTKDLFFSIVSVPITISAARACPMATLPCRRSGTVPGSHEKQVVPWFCIVSLADQHSFLRFVIREHLIEIVLVGQLVRNGTKPSTFLGFFFVLYFHAEALKL